MKNDVSSFFYYMWNKWSEDEAKIVFAERKRNARKKNAKQRSSRSRLTSACLAASKVVEICGAGI